MTRVAIYPRLTATYPALTRCCLAGVIMDNVALPYALIMSHCLTIRGQFAQNRADVARAINLIETGSMRLKKTITEEFQLQDHEIALRAVKQAGGWARMVLFRLD